MFEISKIYRKFFLVILVIFTIVIILALWFQAVTYISPPKIKITGDTSLLVKNPTPEFYTCGNNWLKKNKNGLWEMYLEGSAFERGVIQGKLSKELIYFQEKAFTDEILKRIPSPSYLKFLKYFIYWFNRDIDDYVPEEYKEEIYGISLSASNKYAYIGTNYQRILNYHSAHDIGHALQEMKLVGCTSLASWDEMSEDSSLLIGRNFDFYAGDEFALNKIVSFQKPDKGYPFMMITWGGMIGAVSGMNLKGLTITINASKSGIPYSARTPVSLLAREILQYAKNIDEAYKIAESRETFISESLMIGSAADHKAVIIEKSPEKISLFTSDHNFIICANHFQSETFADDPENIKAMKENASVYRQLRVKEDLDTYYPLDPEKMATILRDQKGQKDMAIGMGNEKAINQLIAHHSIIFEPEKGLVWVSEGPWQIGSYVCYDLVKIFHNFAGLQSDREITETDKQIPPDPFLESLQYKQLQRYRELRNRTIAATGSHEKLMIPETILSEMINLNPDYFEAYETAGDYFSVTGSIDKALSSYRQALNKVISRKNEKDRIIEKMAEIIVKKKTKN